MSKVEKLKQRLARRPKDFSFRELCALLKACGYELESGGKTGGSRRRFYNEKTEKVIMMHEPHPGGILKAYQVDDVLKLLKEEGQL